jgi:flavin-dependent dehydrogenase
MFRRMYVMVGLAMLCANGCHSKVTTKAGMTTGPEGAVAYRAIESPGTVHVELGKSQASIGAAPIDHPAPVYPVQMLPRHIPSIEIRAKVIVDADGAVTETRDLDAVSDADHEAFVSAVRNATSKWRFVPMTIVDSETLRDGTEIEKSRHNEPFSLDYAFIFSLQDGKPVVSTAPSNP